MKEKQDTKTQNPLEAADQKRQLRLWNKPSISYLGRLKDIVRGAGVSVADGGSGNRRPAK